MGRKRFIKQKHAASCGPTAVVNLARALGYDPDYDSIRKRIQIYTHGTPHNLVTHELRRILGRKYTVRVTINKRRPLIDHLNAGGHGIALYVTGDSPRLTHYAALTPRERGLYGMINASPIHIMPTRSRIQWKTLDWYLVWRAARRTNVYPVCWLVSPRKKSLTKRARAGKVRR